MPIQYTEAFIKVNYEVKRRMVDKIFDICDDSVNVKTIAVLDVTFKPNTDDRRDASRLTNVLPLFGNGANVRIVDPQGQREGATLLPCVAWMDCPYAAKNGAYAIVILTEWNEFCSLDLAQMACVMTSPAITDLLNIYSAGGAAATGFTQYVSVDRAAAAIEA